MPVRRSSGLISEADMIVDNEARSLKDRVFDELEDEILSGKLKSGDPLTELALCKRLGVSRTPIRGALQRLADEGLVDMLPNRGAVVLGVTEGDLIDIYTIRMRLEGLAAANAAERMTEADKDRLEGLVDLAEFYIQRGDIEQLKELDTEFHKIIYRASGNRMLGSMLENMHKSIKTYRKLSLSVTERNRDSQREHKEILDAIKRGDSAEADRLTSAHISAALSNILSSLEK